MPFKDQLKVGQTLVSPKTNEHYEVTALGKRYLLVEVTSLDMGKHEFSRRYEEVEDYVIVRQPDNA